MPVALRTRRFTVDEYYRMAQVGILSEQDRVELIDGEVLPMSPIGSRHSATVDRVNHAFNSRLSGRAIVRVQGPVRLDLYTEPEPDILLLRPRADFYASGHPGPADVLLIVEVADSSIGYDRDVKAYIYARSGVPEYWLLDLNENVLIRHASPDGGTYRVVDRLDAQARLAPALLPDCAIGVGDLIGR
jgi:Uma2 family endonuclease